MATTSIQGRYHQCCCPKLAGLSQAGAPHCCLLPGLQVATLQPAVPDGAKLWPAGCWGPELLRMGFGWEAVIVSPPQGETALLSSHMWPLGPVAPGIFAGGIKMRDQLLVTGTGDAAGP